MVDGIQLALRIGPGVPVRAPRAVIEALISVSIQSGSGSPTVFELDFNVAADSMVQTLFVLKNATQLAPPFRVIISVTMNGRDEVICDGIMTDHVTHPGRPGQPSRIKIRGTDLTALMDLIPFTGFPYPAMPVEARVLAILAKYAVLGIVPRIIPRVVQDVPNPLESIPAHQGTDLEYLEQLADEAGYVFYLEPGPTAGANIAHWGPEIKLGPRQPALSMNFEHESNVDDMQFTFRNDSQELPVVRIQNRETRTSVNIPIRDVGLINPPLGLVPPIPRRIRIIDDVAKRSVPEAILFGLARAAQTADSVSGTGSLNVLRFGSILKARKLVGVRGVGTPFNGLYYVNGVDHSIKRGEYTQRFQLSRNGLVSTVNEVRA